MDCRRPRRRNEIHGSARRPRRSQARLARSRRARGRAASLFAPSTTTRRILTRPQVHDPDRGWISRYAWSREDYHDAVLAPPEAGGSALCAGGACRSAEPALTTRSYVDTGPVVERVFAKYAGVGWIGKNTCIINQKKGSWLFLGVILTSLELAPDLPAPDRCGTCTRCIDACPTDALLAPYQLDSNRCISYLTIEKRGSIPEDLRAGMGHHVFGCDICQDVCPWNRKAPASTAPEFEAAPRPGESRAGVAGRNVRGRIPRNLPRIAHPPHQALRPSPQCRHRHGQ